MSVHGKLRVPRGHGELLCVPPFQEWGEAARQNRESLGTLAGPLAEVRAQARSEALAVARAYTRALGVAFREPSAGATIVMTGHQPELFHPGVWAKYLLLQRFCDEAQAVGIDVVVDTDAVRGLRLQVPCLAPGPAVCEHVLVEAGPDRTYAQTPAPDARARAAFRRAGLTALATRPTPSLTRHFSTYCDALERAAAVADDVGALVTAARRFYEEPLHTDYLELPVSRQVMTEGYRLFAGMLLVDARTFRDVHNAELASYRARTGARSPAQPVPDLEASEGAVEVPFWLVDDEGRAAAFVDERRRLLARGRAVAELGESPQSAARALEREGLLLAPRALTLTLFERLCVADLFVHGAGGGRYDRVTDAIARSYFGVIPPRYTVVSLTLLLPLGERQTTDAEVAAAKQRLSRLAHNPDRFLDEIEFDTLEERVFAEELAASKAALLKAIEAPGADRAELGREIRRVNRALADLIAPAVEEARAELERLLAAREAAALLTDRNYPFFLWDPREVADKVR